MRIWSLHPKYLDVKGLVALWRETLLAQKVLANETKGYKNHPQLNRFKEQIDPMAYIGTYLFHTFKEAEKRGYNFDQSKILKLLPRTSRKKITVTSGQLDFELKHLNKKLRVRDIKKLKENKTYDLELHPLLREIPGDIESWEK